MDMKKNTYKLTKKRVIMRIYTKTGDTGTSSLFSGKKVSKTHPRLKSYGTLDELNSHIGVLVQSLNKVQLDTRSRGAIEKQCQLIQAWLFTMGSHLACDDEKVREKLSPLELEWATQMEHWIDEFDEELPPLKNFILPGGTEPACHAHVCRTVCRRAERNVCEALEEKIEVSPVIIQSLNRASDYFFTLARWINFKLNHSEKTWQSQ